MRVINTDGGLRAFMSDLEERGDSSSQSSESFAAERTVRSVINEVKEKGDVAVKEYTARFDCDNPMYYRVPKDVIGETYKKYKSDPNQQKFLEALKRCHANIEKFHTAQKREGYTISEKNGVVTGQRIRPLKTVGLYVPGGTAAYPSSVLMNAIPAKIAGVERIIICTPPRKDGTANPDILVAAKLCGITEIYLCGGAQAVAAMAFGTDNIPKVDKVVGPGNIYVTLAKKLLFGIIDIDMIAGPSEILIIADKSANPVYIAADLLSQAEHDALASSVVITDSGIVAERTVAEVERQLALLPRREMAQESLDSYGAIILVKDMDEAIELAEKIAPEHCEILCENPLEYIGKLDNVGSLFLGEYSPEPLGDYYAGPNHVLPTNGTARFFSPLNVDSFTKKTSYIYYTKNALKEASDDIILIAQREELTAHANAIRVRTDVEIGS
ncbi:MAG: histidinol dehydrogenase [Oscillospiraceae bacterium]|nr:histidinol dehydrogenase [Oscillospiraceae bacterium]